MLGACQHRKTFAKSADPVRRCLTKFGEVDDDEASGNTSVALTMYEEVSAVARGGVTQLNDSVVATEGKPSKIDDWNGSMARQGRLDPVSEPIQQIVLPQETAACGKIVIFCYRSDSCPKNDLLARRSFRWALIVLASFVWCWWG